MNCSEGDVHCKIVPDVKENRRISKESNHITLMHWDIRKCLLTHATCDVIFTIKKPDAVGTYIFKVNNRMTRA